MPAVQIKFTWDASKLEEGFKRLSAAIRANSPFVLKKSVVVFANAAAKFTMPARDSFVIPIEKYRRPFVSLAALKAGKYPDVPFTHIDEYQMKRGMKYKIYNTKREHRMSRAKAFAYCKYQADIEKYSRIINRGLAKAMWGKSLDQIGLDIPIGFRRLIGKSPNLAKLPYSETKLFQESPDKFTVTIKNMAEDIQKYADYAKLKGYRAAEREMKHRLKALVEQANPDRTMASLISTDFAGGDLS